MVLINYGSMVHLNNYMQFKISFIMLKSFHIAFSHANKIKTESTKTSGNWLCRGIYIKSSMRNLTFTLVTRRFKETLKPCNGQ